MESLQYRGSIYRRISGKWCDDRNYIVSETLQRELNNEYVAQSYSDISHFDTKTLIHEGDKFKECATYNLAIKFYEAACRKCERKDMSYILPRISSCYRKAHQSAKAIEMFSFAKKKFGKDIIMTEALLTTVAAAYCDLHEYENAKKCCDIAYARAKGMVGGELRMVYRRIEKEKIMEQ